MNDKVDAVKVGRQVVLELIEDDKNLSQIKKVHTEAAYYKNGRNHQRFFRCTCFTWCRF